jgi:hypothetical protein
MSKSILKISSFFLILGLCYISIIGSSQDLNLSRKEKKEAKKTEAILNYNSLGVLLESRKFVFEANRRQSKDGSVVIINPNINYIIIDSMSYTTTIFGLKPNEGVLTRWVLLKNNKKLSYSIKFDMQISPAMSVATSVYEIYMDVYANKNAKVRMKRNLGITYTGINETLYYGQIKTL